MSSWTDTVLSRASEGPHRPDGFSRRRLLTRTGAAAVAASSALLLSPAMLTACGSPPTLLCQHQRTGEVYAELQVDQGAEITHSWIHSIERSRWTDTYRLRGSSLMLITTSFSEYGAGMPLDEGDLRVEDGQIVIENIDREFEAIRWFHSHRVDYRIGVAGREDLVDAAALPDRQPIELRPR